MQRAEGWKSLTMRDTKVLEAFLKSNYKKIIEMNLFRNLKKEVETGANGTQSYIIKKGINKDKEIKKIWHYQTHLIYFGFTEVDFTKT